MGWLAAVGQAAAGESAVAETGASVGEVAASQAAGGAADAAAADSASASSGIGAAASKAATSVPEFNDITNPTPSFAPSEADLGKVSSSSLQGFKPYPSFLDNAESFGKDFGMQLSKQLIQGALRQVPGGRTVGTILSRSFDSPTLKSLFADQNDEVSKRDDIIQMLLKQRLGKV